MSDAALTRPLAVAEHAQDGNIPALTGLRFFAAISVALAHGKIMILKFEPPIAIVDKIPHLAGFGMTLFFVLSGFVIHYNYRYMVTTRGWVGVGTFLWARFARLYPLFLLMLVLDVLLGRKLFDFMVGNVVSFADVLRSLPYYLVLAQSWVYVPFTDNALIYVTGNNVALTWSISTEWFFYLAYPAAALLVLRLRRPAIILGAMLFWSVLWCAIASSLDANAAAIDSWAVERYGAIAGMANGYQDSFVRWIEYFSPYLRIGEFGLGCLTAQLYLQLREHPVTAREQAIGRHLLPIGLIGVPLVIFLTYIYQAPLLFHMRNNYALAPTIALILFGAARYETTISRFLRSRPLVALGEASYSIYLLHFLILLVISSYIGQTLPPTIPNALFLTLRFAFVMSLICLISLGTHAVIEVPARRWLRGLAATGRWRLPMSIAALPVAAVVLCLAMQSQLLPEKTEVNAGIRLVSATYGGNCGAKRGNATRAVVAECNGRDRCDYIVDVAKLGDPVSNCAKDFAVDYACMPENVPRHAAVPGEAGFSSHAQLTCTGTASPQTAAAAQTIGPRTDLAVPIVPAPPRAADSIEVLSATYGGNCGAKQGNATRALAAACNGKVGCNYIVDVTKLGDPASGCGKDFAAEYACLPSTAPRQVDLPDEAGLGSHLLLDCAATPSQQAAAAPTASVPPAHPAAGIDILSATYGANCGARAGNATAPVRAACSGKLDCSYVVEVSRLGDPASGCRKDFTITYQCPGSAAARTGEAPAEAGFGAAVELSCP
jgi:peptidoglycan/LPS O-acetylase OafA/YrhL